MENSNENFTLKEGKSFNIDHSSPNKKKLENSFRKFENEVESNEKFGFFKNFYEMRMQALQESIKDAVYQIINDDLLKTMKEDSTSFEFSHQRIKEIFEDVISNDREVIIEKLTMQYSNLKNEYAKCEEEKNKV